MNSKTFRKSDLPLPTSSLPPFDNELDPRIVELHFVIRNEREEVNGQHDNWNGYFALLSNGTYLCLDGVPIIFFIRDHIVHALGGKIGYRLDDPNGSMNDVFRRFVMTYRADPGCKVSEKSCIPIADLAPEETQWDIKLHIHAPLHPDSLSCYEHAQYHSRLLLFKENASMTEICDESNWMISAKQMDGLRASQRTRARQLLKYRRRERQE